MLADRGATLDVRIASDGQLCKQVPRRFLRRMGSGRSAPDAAAMVTTATPPAVAANASGGSSSSLGTVEAMEVEAAAAEAPPAPLPLPPNLSQGQLQRHSPAPRPALPPPCRVVLRAPPTAGGGGGGAARLSEEEVEVDEAAFMGRFMALRQYVELARSAAGVCKASEAPSALSS